MEKEHSPSASENSPCSFRTLLTSHLVSKGEASGKDQRKTIQSVYRFFCFKLIYGGCVRKRCALDKIWLRLRHDHT